MRMNKICSIDDALGLIRSGDTIAIGGFTLYRRPVQFCKSITESGLKDLSIVTLTAGIETDILVKAGCVSSIRTCYAGLEILGRTPHICRSTEAGKLKFIEETEYTLSHGVLAAMIRVPYLPCSSPLQDTDYVKIRPELSSPQDNLIHIPAVHADVAIIHVQKADRKGNAVITGQNGLDSYLPFISNKTILTAEEIVETDDLRGANVSILQQQVDAVVEIPNGAMPTSCFPSYSVDIVEVLGYLEDHEM